MNGELSDILLEAAQEIYDMEYYSWYNTDTMRTFDEWADKSRMELIDRLRQFAFKE